jgi:hypothetical protein
VSISLTAKGGGRDLGDVARGSAIEEGLEILGNAGDGALLGHLVDVCDHDREPLREGGQDEELLALRIHPPIHTKGSGPPLPRMGRSGEQMLMLGEGRGSHVVGMGGLATGSAKRFPSSSKAADRTFHSLCSIRSTSPHHGQGYRAVRGRWPSAPPCRPPSFSLAAAPSVLPGGQREGREEFRHTGGGDMRYG